MGPYLRTAVVDPLGHQTATLTDAFGREGYAERYTGNSPGTYALYASTRYYYNLDGSLATILQPNGASTSFTYDGGGRQVGLSDPDRGSESYTYDADGNRLSSVDARGAAGTLWAGYDGIDRQTWRNTTNTSTGAYVTYTYDSTAGGNQGVGHLTGEHFTGAPGGPNAGFSGAYAYVYDARGQQASETATLGGTPYTVGTSYDDAGSVTGQTYPDGETVSYDVDSQLGWLAGVTDLNGQTQTNLLTNTAYTGPGGAAGDLTGASLANGVYTYAAGYDLLVRPTTTLITKTSGGATEFYQSRTYDAGSELTGLQTDLQGQTDYQAFCYDEQSRLTWASSASGTIPCGGTNPTGTLTGAQYTQTFGYDNLGRLTSGPLGSYVYGNSAHVHAATAVGSTWTAAYDAAGDMTCRAATGANSCAGNSPNGSPLTWDTEGRLIEWSSPTGAPWSSSIDLYDGEGNRVQQQTVSGGVTTQTYYIGNLEEVSVSGGTTTTTTYYYAGNGGPRIATATNGVISYLASDTLGTAEVALDANGNTTAAVLYAPYGTTRYSSGTMPGSYGYAGQHADAVTGLDYYGARYYDAAAGQFASADTVLPGKGYDVWGLSRYAYVEGNPITRGDPSGHRLACSDTCGDSGWVGTLSLQSIGLSLYSAGISYAHARALYNAKLARELVPEMVDQVIKGRQGKGGRILYKRVPSGRMVPKDPAGADDWEADAQSFDLFGIGLAGIGFTIDGVLSYYRYYDQHPNDPDRTTNALAYGVLHASIVTAGGVIGASVGALAAIVCDVCALVTEPAGGMIGAYAGEQIADSVLSNFSPPPTPTLESVVGTINDGLNSIAQSVNLPIGPINIGVPTFNFSFP